jgi:hypothetical protein
MFVVPNAISGRTGERLDDQVVLRLRIVGSRSPLPAVVAEEGLQIHN